MAYVYIYLVRSLNVTANKSLLEINSKKIKKKVNSFDFHDDLNVLENNIQLGKIYVMDSETTDLLSQSKFWVM